MLVLRNENESWCYFTLGTSKPLLFLNNCRPFCFGVGYTLMWHVDSITVGLLSYQHGDTGTPDHKSRFLVLGLFNFKNFPIQSHFQAHLGLGLHFFCLWWQHLILTWLQAPSILHGHRRTEGPACSTAWAQLLLRNEGMMHPNVTSRPAPT
jgi:hypothetical protein